MNTNIKDKFPYFKNSDIVYLDNSATTQKPSSVIDAMDEYYLKYCANTHRSNFSSANKATIEYEKTRKLLKEFINANSLKEIVFTKGVTESINMVVSSFAKDIKTVIISSLEHHANIVPWHMQGRTLNDGLMVVKYKDNLHFDMESFEEILKQNPNSLVSITHISNAFGVIHDIKAITKKAKEYGCYVLIDAAQSLVHEELDVQEIGCDFVALSAHKSFGPTGVGALYIKEELLDKFIPYQTGGATIQSVSYEKSVLLPSPYKFEAGTQNIAGVIGFGKALEFINSIGIDTIKKADEEIYKYLDTKLREIEEIELYNDTNGAVASKSFNVKGVIHDDVGILLDKQNIAIRVGHHCAMPIMSELGIKGTIRVSTSFYNDKDDIDKFIKALKRAINMLKG